MVSAVPTGPYQAQREEMLKKCEVMEETLQYLETNFCFYFEGYVWAGFKVFLGIASFMNIRAEVLFKRYEGTGTIRLSVRLGCPKETGQPQ